MPVLPAVGSMIVPPGFSSPVFAARSIIPMPIRSLTEKPGLRSSIFTKMSESAAAGSDFVPVPGTVNVTFNPGVKTKTYTVKVIGDRVRELNERFFFNLAGLSSNAYFVKYQGKGTILNDD